MNAVVAENLLNRTFKAPCASLPKIFVWNCAGFRSIIYITCAPMPKYLLTCLLTYRSYRPTQRQVLEVFEKCFFFNFVPKVWVCSPCSSSGYATVKHCIRRAIVSSPREIKQISLTVAAIYNYIFHVSNVTGLLGTRAIHNSS